MNRAVSAFLVALMVAVVPQAWAQSISGDLVVKVMDPSGSNVSGAKVALIEVATNIRQELKTDNQGLVLFLNLKPGEYQAEIAQQGFQKQTVKDMRIQVGQRARVDVELKLGQLTESVTVSAASETLLNRESAAIGQVLDRTAITNLPLSGRNFLQLAAITAGAIPIGTGTSPATTWTGRSDMSLSIAGGRESNNSFLLNGIQTRNARFGSVGIRPSIEAIQEFKIQRSTFGAEFGRSASIINTTLRGGTNELHGSEFDFWQNRVMNATDFFLNRTGRVKPPLNLHNFGTAVGGPVLIPGLYNGRNRTFWFFNYEAQRQRVSSAATAIYPSRAQLEGNLADDSAGTGILDRGSALCLANPTARLAFQFIPTPNVSVAAGQTLFPTFNTVATPGQINDWDQYNVRLDHQFSTRDQVFGTYSQSDETRDVKVLRPLGGEGFPLSNRLVTATWNRTISPTILNEARFGFNRSVTFRLSETSFTQDYAREVFNLKNINTQPIVFGVPSFGISGFSAIGSISQAIGATDQNYQFTDNFSVIRGKHNVRTGIQISRQQLGLKILW
jgi:hypothetical protein